MPTSKEHSVAGCVTGLSLLGIWELYSQSNAIQKNPYLKFDWGKVIGKLSAGALVGSIAGVLLDVLEPATNPHHRHFFHSKSAVALTTVGLWKVGTSKIDTGTKQFISCVLVGILSHHYGDSQTEFGLPDY